MLERSVGGVHAALGDEGEKVMVNIHPGEEV